MLNISWKNVTEAIIPLLIMAGLGWYRKNILIWLKKQKLRFFPAKFNVALSVDFKEGLNSGNYFEQIKNNLICSIDETGLHDYIKLNDFSDIQKFNDKNEAELFKNKKKIDLIIWGTFSNDGLKKNGELISKINLNFTYGHPDDKERTIGKMVLLDINSKLAQKNYWQVIDKNSLNDVGIISNNIFDISTYILALTLKLYGRIEKSLFLTERLYNNLKKRQDNFEQHLIPHLINCYEIIIIESGINGKNYETGKNLCKKLLLLRKNYHFALINLAVFQYKTGEKLEAEKSVGLLSKYHPNNPSTILDVAFFAILQKRYRDAYNHYDSLTKCSEIDFNPQDVIEFLYNEYQLHKDPALLFGTGIISMRFGDKNIGKKDLKSFLNKANEGTYKLMYKKAKKILKKIER